MGNRTDDDVLTATNPWEAHRRAHDRASELEREVIALRAEVERLTKELASARTDAEIHEGIARQLDADFADVARTAPLQKETALVADRDRARNEAHALREERDQARRERDEARAACVIRLLNEAARIEDSLKGWSPFAIQYESKDRDLDRASAFRAAANLIREMPAGEPARPKTLHDAIALARGSAEPPTQRVAFAAADASPEDPKGGVS